MTLADTSEFWIDVPFVKQEGKGCGAAVISMVAQYWNRDNGSAASGEFDPDSIQRALYSKEAEGIFASDLKQYFENHGFQTFVFRAAWDDLQNHLSKGRPLIAAVASNGKSGPLHYVVIVGLDPQKQIVLLNDPAQRKLLKMRRSEMDRIWKATNNWTLLAVPRDAKD